MYAAPPREPSHGELPPRDTSILVIAEHALVRAGLRAVLGSTPGLAVVAEAPDLGCATPLAAEHRPDVVLLDAPPATEAEPSMAALCDAAPEACVLCLADPDRRAACALPCIPCDAGVPELCAALGTLLGGRCAACVLRRRCAAPGSVSLSPREKQVAVHVAAGLASKQIAARLGIGLRTVNTYRESLARKLGASSPAVLTRYVLEHGLDAELPIVGA